MSKIGVQSQSGVIQDMGKLLARRPIAWLLLGNALNLDTARAIRQQSPDTLILLRTGGDWAYKDDQWNANYLDIALRVAAPFQREGLCDFLLPPNEPVVWNDVEARQLNERMVWFARQYRANGYRTGAYNFSVGNPDYPLWPWLQDGIRESDGWLFLHEYGIPGDRANYADMPLRHRKVLPLLAADVRAMLKVGVTECLIDLGANAAYYGHAGGYRMMPDNGHLIEDYLNFLEWWDLQLLDDPYVKFANVFGYAMEEPWVSRGFDVAMDDEDRAKFIGWMQPGKVDLTPVPPQPPILPPVEETMITPSEIAGAIPFLVKQGIKQGFGPSLYGERDVKAADGKLYHLWVFSKGGLGCEDGKYADSDVFTFDPVTGAINTIGNVTPPVVEPPAPSNWFPAALTAIGAVGEKGAATMGQRFFALSGASTRTGVSAFCKVVVIGKGGVPAIGAKVVNLFPDGNGEVLYTDGSGMATFYFAASSAFTNPGTGPFTVFVADDSAYKDYDSIPKRVAYKYKLSDTVKSLGDYRGEHTEIYLQFAEA